MGNEHLISGNQGDCRWFLPNLGDLGPGERMKTGRWYLGGNPRWISWDRSVRCAACRTLRSEARYRVCFSKLLVGRRICAFGGGFLSGTSSPMASARKKKRRPNCDRPRRNDRDPAISSGAQRTASIWGVKDALWSQRTAWGALWGNRKPSIEEESERIRRR